MAWPYNSNFPTFSDAHSKSSPEWHHAFGVKHEDSKSSPERQHASGEKHEDSKSNPQWQQAFGVKLENLKSSSPPFKKKKSNHPKWHPTFGENLEDLKSDGSQWQQAFGVKLENLKSSSPPFKKKKSNYPKWHHTFGENLEDLKSDGSQWQQAFGVKLENLKSSSPPFKKKKSNHPKWHHTFGENLEDLKSDSSQWQHAFGKKREDLKSNCPERQHAFPEKFEDLKLKHKLNRRRAPLLLAPTSDNCGEERFCLFDVMQGKSLVEFKYRPGRNWRCEGCSQGWLILVNDYKVILYDLFSGKLVHLPPLETSLCKYEIMTPKLIGFGKLDGTNRFRRIPRRGVLSGDANKDSFVLMVRHTSYVIPLDDDDDFSAHIDYNSGIKHMIAFIRSGDKDWTYQEWQGVEDIICINGLFYLLDRSGMIFSCEVNSDGYKLRQVPSHSLKNPSLVESPSESYLVESPGGDLLRVINRYWNQFTVYKLVWHDSKNASWEEVANLGDVALFVGESHSVSVKASDFVGCRSNSIYYSRHSLHFLMQHLMQPVKPRVRHVMQPLKHPLEPHFVGSAFIFSLNNKTIESLYPRCHPNIWQPLLWISPNIV